MGQMLNRRRVMGGHDEIIMTSETNPEVLAVCYAQGWAKHADYMTKREAEAVTSIGTVFRGNTQITHFEELQYFTSLTQVPSQGFYRCSNLENITLPDTIIDLGYESFRECSSLEIINLSNVKYIQSFAFCRCPSIVSINIENCEQLGFGAFFDCTNLTNIGSVANIMSLVDGNYGQFQNTKLTGEFIFEKAMGSAIPNGIFQNVVGITDVSFPLLDYTSIGAYAFRSTGIPSFVVREGCTTLNNHSFSYSDALLFLDLPTTLTTWNGYACHSDRALKVIVCRATTPPTGLNGDSFSQIPSTCKVYVPNASISAYEAATGWDNLAGKYVPIEGSWYETHRSLCPYDAELEYLESETGVWLDTGVVPDFSTTVEIKGILYTEGSYLAAANTGGAYYVLMHRDATYCRWILGSNTGSLYHGLYNKEITILFNEYQTHKAYIDGVEKQTFPSGNVVSTQTTLALFAANGLGTNHYTGKVRINYCKILVDGVLVRDFIPVRKGQVGYMYDKVSGTLFGNSGTGDFVLGPDKVIIMTKESNAPMLAVCYAQGWCASPDYMTKAEADAVTNIGSAFNNNTDITFFDLSCFTGLTIISNGTTYGMTSCVDMALPSSLTTIGNNFMNGAADIEYFVINEGCTSIGNALGGSNNNTKLFVLPSTLTSLGYLYKGTSSQLPHADLIIKSVTPPGGSFGNASLWDYVYVPDESIQAYQTAYSSLASKIHGKSELPDKYRDFWP